MIFYLALLLLVLPLLVDSTCLMVLGWDVLRRAIR